MNFRSVISVLVACATMILSALGADEKSMDCNGIRCSVSCDSGIATAVCGNARFRGTCTPAPASAVNPGIQQANNSPVSVRVYFALVRDTQVVSDLNFGTVSKTLREFVKNGWKQQGDHSEMEFTLRNVRYRAMASITPGTAEKLFNGLDWPTVDKAENLLGELPSNVTDVEFKAKITDVLRR